MKLRIALAMALAVACQHPETEELKGDEPISGAYQLNNGINSKFSDEYEKCSSLVRQQNLKDAQDSCRRSLALAEELPEENNLERYYGQKALGEVLLRQLKPTESIPFLEESLRIAKRVPDDKHVELGEVYFLLGQAHYQLHNLDKTLEYYKEAEGTYRSAFPNVDGEETRRRYAGMLLWILETHSYVVEEANMRDEAVDVQLRIYKVRKDFAKYLKNSTE